MPPPSSANVIRRKKQGSPAAAAAIIGSSVSVEEEEMLSDELSELDAMLVSNIGINAESLSGRQQQQMQQQQRRRSSTTALLNDSPSVAAAAAAAAAVTTNGHISSPLFPAISAQSASSTANGYHHLSATRATRPKAQWLELLEEKEVTVLEHTEVLQAVLTTTSSSLPHSTANSTTTTTHSVFTFNTVPTVSTVAAAAAAANAGTASRCSAGQARENSPLSRELGNQSASLPASSALSGPVSPTSPALAAENARENSVVCRRNSSF